MCEGGSDEGGSDAATGGEIQKNPAGLCNSIVDTMKQHDNLTDVAVMFVRETSADFQTAFDNETNAGGDVGV